MFYIGDFSKLAKTTTKTLRFYDEIDLLKPSFVDENNGYRYYEAKQLLDLNKIIALRQLDSEYKEGDIRIAYEKAVELPTIHDNKKFKIYDATLLACIYHKGSYNRFPRAYGYIIDWIEKNSYSMIDSPRECYIKGSFDTSDTDEWVTEIQIPVVKK